VKGEGGKERRGGKRKAFIIRKKKQQEIFIKVLLQYCEGKGKGMRRCLGTYWFFKPKMGGLAPKRDTPPHTGTTNEKSTGRTKKNYFGVRKPPTQMGAVGWGRG